MLVMIDVVYRYILMISVADMISFSPGMGVQTVRGLFFRVRCPVLSKI